jgi:hypothetical protein
MNHRYYYGVQSGLSYILNHYFYGAIHYTYLAREYYTYRRKNPRSSNPHRVYEDLYEPWKDKDEYSKVINQSRLNIKNGILAQKTRGTITTAQALRLGLICDEIDVGVFYPLVYRVDIASISRARLLKAGSGLTGSLEYLIEGLNESEINEILFLDYEKDEVIKVLIRDEWNYFRTTGKKQVSTTKALQILNERVRKHAIKKSIRATGP